MAILVPEKIYQERIGIDSSKICFTPITSLELILEKRDPIVYEKGFDVLLRLSGKQVFHDYRVYFSPEREQAQQKYKECLQQLQSGQYHLTFDPENGTVTINNPSPVLQK